MLEEQLAAAQAREAELLADNARLRGKLAYAELILRKEYNHVVPSIVNALAATPVKSLARIRNQWLEEAAKEAEHWQTISTTPGHACGQYIAAAIRAMKEPE